METSVTAAEVLVPPQPGGGAENPGGEEVAAPPPAASSSSSSSSSSDHVDPMEEFNRRLQDIISTHGSAAELLSKHSVMEAETEKMKEPRDNIPVAIETEVCLIMKSLNKLSSPEQKLEDVVRKYAELASQRRADEKKLNVLQQKVSVLLDERQRLQDESHSSVVARSKLESLCRELQGHYSVLREETLQRCREDEEKRTEITTHFQMMLTEIQAQIEQHSNRNDKLCHENSNLTDRLESLMNQCEMREESLEKISKHRDLQHKLTDAKLQQANALLAEAEEKHKREKEYLLREAIDKTKKCFAMKEQELTMKKKLTLYAEKFDEFQATLAKSNEIYVRFKKEMDNMSDKMKKMEKESNLWKVRFENCNKALNDMIEERTEKSKEYDLFVIKIQKLERLCNALQRERVILYDKIKEVRKANSDIPAKVFGSPPAVETPEPEVEAKPAALTPVEIQELQELQKDDPVLTEDMARLREEQAKLQEIANSLLTTSASNAEDEKEDVDPEEDMMSAAFVQFQTKTQVQEAASSVPQDIVDRKSEETKSDQVQKSVVSTTYEILPRTEDTKSETQEVQPVKPQDEIKQEVVEPVVTSEPEEVKINPSAEPEPEGAEVSVQAGDVKPVEDRKSQAEAAQEPEQTPNKSESAKNTPKASSTESSKKQTPKKKKKRNGKNPS